MALFGRKNQMPTPDEALPGRKLEEHREEFGRFHTFAQRAPQ